VREAAVVKVDSRDDLGRRGSTLAGRRPILPRPIAGLDAQRGWVREPRAVLVFTGVSSGSAHLPASAVSRRKAEPDGTRPPKTLANIERHGEFVHPRVNDALGAADETRRRAKHPYGEDEFVHAWLTSCVPKKVATSAYRREPVRDGVPARAHRRGGARRDA
jgi:hypothetical protein